MFYCRVMFWFLVGLVHLVSGCDGVMLGMLEEGLLFTERASSTTLKKVTLESKMQEL